MATAKDICQSVPNWCLDLTVSDEHVAEIAKNMRKWRELAPFLKLSPAEEEDIVEQYERDLPLQRREALQKWKEMNGSQATYRRLVVIFCSHGRADLAEMVKDLLLDGKDQLPNASACAVPSTQTSVTDKFHDHLCGWYSSLPHPASFQWPDKCPIQVYVELALNDVPVNDGSPEQCRPIALESLLAAGNFQMSLKRNIVLIEGIAGVGKTTLSWHACKEWAAGKLFKDIKLLIHVPLSDPLIHSATKLADLIPHSSETMREKVAETITLDRGKGTCFWLEGCDEAPSSMWKAFLSRFVTGTGVRSMLPDVHIILTSRPGSRAVSEMKNILTGKVVIRGFRSLKSFISSCSLQVDKDELFEALVTKPELHSLCYLPLNAVIMVYLYDMFKDDLPVTRTGLFDLLVRHFIIRHIKKTNPDYEAESIVNYPSDLPGNVHLSLTKVSELAYKSLIQRKKIIDPRMLSEFGLAGIDNALGLLQVQLRSTVCGPSKQLSFIHLTLQEFLAAFHISHISEDRQVVAIKTVFGQNPLSPVLVFYAGLNGLIVKEARDVLLSVLNRSINAVEVIRELRLLEGNTSAGISSAHIQCHDPRRQLLSVMNCLYETQDPDLFAHVQLVSDVRQELLALEALERLPADDKEANLPLPKDARLFFACMYLYPTDCLSIGYFVRHARYGEENRVYLDLSCAVLLNREIKALTHEMHKPSPAKNNVYLNINGVILTEYSLHCLNTIFNPQSCLIGLELSCSEILNIHLAMKYFVEGYARSHCNCLTLGECQSKNIIHYMILLLRCSPKLVILNLPFCTGLFTRPILTLSFCKALTYSEVQHLSLDGCGINDNSLMILALAVCHKDCILQILEIDRNLYTDQGLTKFLEMLLRQWPFVYLRMLSVNNIINEHHEHVNLLNRYRKNHDHKKVQLYPHELIIRCKSQLRSQHKDKDEGYFSLMRLDLAFPQNLHH